MKLVIISDTHTLHRDIENIPAGDVLIHCGDICLGLDLFDNRKTIYDFCEWMQELDFAFKICIGGNHDNVLQKDQELTKVFDTHGINYLCDDIVTHEGISFYGTPWCTPCYGAFNEHEDGIRSKLKKIDTVDVLVTHSPPLDILDDSSHGRNVGSVAIAQLARSLKPKLHCFGHCHNRGNEEEEIDGIKYMNAAMTSPNRRIWSDPMVFEL